jgi:hypothetical protein
MARSRFRPSTGFLTTTVVLGLLAAAIPARAARYTWEMTAGEDQIKNAGTLDGSTDSGATGAATIVYDDFNDSLSGTVTWDFTLGDGPSKGLTKMHIHGPSGPDASNPTHLFDIFTETTEILGAGLSQLADTYEFSTTLSERVQATSTLDGATIDDILGHMAAGNAYVNYHSEFWPNGEIRANFVLAALDSEQTKTQQKCSATLYKAMSQYQKLVSKRSDGCFKDHATGKVTDVGGCLEADPKDKIAAANTYWDEYLPKMCQGTANDGYPKQAGFGAGVGLHGLDVLEPVDIESLVGMLRIVDGNFDAALADNTSDKNLTKCQLAGLKIWQKCVGTYAKGFSQCSKKGLKGNKGKGVAPFVDAAGLGSCAGEDAKGKIAKACNGKLLDVTLKCETKGVDLDTAFPGCTDYPSLATDECLMQTATCAACRMVAYVAGLGIASVCEDACAPLD